MKKIKNQTPVFIKAEWVDYGKYYSSCKLTFINVSDKEIINPIIEFHVDAGQRVSGHYDFKILHDHDFIQGTRQIQLRSATLSRHS